jgi:hypothetical protein
VDLGQASSFKSGWFDLLMSTPSPRSVPVSLLRCLALALKAMIHESFSPMAAYWNRLSAGIMIRCLTMHIVQSASLPYQGSEFRWTDCDQLPDCEKDGAGGLIGS